MLDKERSLPDPAREEWYVLRVRSRYEKAAASALKGKGYRAFLPLCKRRHRYTHGTREFEVPLFDGYVFCRFNVSARLPVLTTPGIVHILGNSCGPLPVSEAEIVALQRVVSSDLPVEPCEYLATGDRVVIAEGALKGVEGILLYAKSSHRLVLSVTLLQRSAQVEVDRHWVERRSGAKPSSTRDDS